MHCMKMRPIVTNVARSVCLRVCWARELYIKGLTDLGRRLERAQNMHWMEKPGFPIL